MLTDQLDYELPPGLIAQHPLEPRDGSRLLVYDRATREILHRRLLELPSLLRSGDAMIFNDSRVIPARLFLKRRTGGRVEVLFLRRRSPAVWEALARASGKLKPGEELDLAQSGERLPAAGGKDILFVLKEPLADGRWLVGNSSGIPTVDVLKRWGLMPLPPYIREPLDEPERYQTVFAKEPGSAAAPTAGLHFTPGVMRSITEAGAIMLPVTLHIGLDTFRPVGEEELRLHRIHSEFYRVPDETLAGIERARESGGRVVAVGTTSVRVLETVLGGKRRPLEGKTDLFIIPGHEFRATDALLTNFHLPRSTLLAMVMAFAGVEETRRIYEEAIRERYRFYSFGDAMLVL